ncbi:MAG TPA: twin-arginine translocase subunit TatC [Candidatus Limnocylindrales bacterium]|jgi:sec-independent protein translocase protein TatC
MADADLVRDGAGGLVPPAPPPVTAPAVDDETVMSLVDHLSELRRRIGISLLAVAIGSVIGFYFAPQLITILKAPLNLGKPLVYTGLGDAFFINLKIAIVVGFVLAMPVLVWQLWAFISPGLTREERRMARPWAPLALAFFVIGVVVAYVILPFASTFLLSFSSPDLQPLITASEYFGFVTTLCLAFGLVMEYPIVLVLLAKVGIITSARLRSSRRVVILAIAIISAVVTPGGDPISPTVLGVTMYLLYEFSIVLIRAGGR